MRIATCVEDTGKWFHMTSLSLLKYNFVLDADEEEENFPPVGLAGLCVGFCSEGSVRATSTLFQGTGVDEKGHQKHWHASKNVQ